MNGAHRFTVEDGSIVGRTVERSASINSFLCTRQEFDDFELELETAIDPITNSGIQIRSTVRPLQTTGRTFESAAGRVNGPQVEIRRSYKGEPATGLLYGEAMGTNWLSSQQKIDAGHRYFVDEGWNTVRIVARGPRIQTWVNGNLVEDLVNDEVYKTHSRGFIGLQIHGLSEREVNLHPEFGITTRQPLTIKWRHIRIRSLSPRNLDDRQAPLPRFVPAFVCLAVFACVTPALGQSSSDPADTSAQHQHMHMSAADELFPPREASGTSWLPDVTPMFGAKRDWSGWDGHAPWLGIPSVSLRTRQPASNRRLQRAPVLGRQLGHVAGPATKRRGTDRLSRDDQPRAVDAS